MSKVKYHQVQAFRNAASAYLNDPKEKIENHLKYALRKMVKRTAELSEEVNEMIEDLRVEHASVDSDKNLIVEDGKYKYTSEKLKVLNNKIREISKKEHEIEPYFTNYDCKQLPNYFLEPFEGFVLPVDYRDSLLEQKEYSKRGVQEATDEEIAKEEIPKHLVGHDIS